MVVRIAYRLSARLAEPNYRVRVTLKFPLLSRNPTSCPRRSLAVKSVSIVASRSPPGTNRVVYSSVFAGSSGDLLKIAKPNEFDLVFKMEIPYSETIVVTRDSKMPGNVLLDMTRVLEILKDDPREDRQSIRKLLLSLVWNNYLVVDRLQSWLQSLFSRALDRIGYRVEVDGVVSQLRYKTCGPAHTIFVEGELEYSVDFVPAIRLGAEQNVLGAHQLTDFRRANLSHWDAIPKPLKISSSQISFRSSFYEAEKAMLRGKNMKNCLNGIKLIKKFRDVKTNLSNLKSYYIKTLFLWKIRQELPHYWLRPLTVILTDMFDELTECLRQGRLAFYWDPELNMLDVLTRDQVTEMYRCVQGFSDILRRNFRSVPFCRTGGSPLVVLRAFSHKEERSPQLSSHRIVKRKDIKRLQHRYAS